MNRIAQAIREAGVAGAGGAGFPSYAKWTDLDELDSLMINHHESEPCYYADKWLGREHATELADLIELLLDEFLDVVVIGTKEKYWDAGWLDPLANATDATSYGPDDLPVDIEQESGVVFACTPDVYTFSEERVLLRVAAGVSLDGDLPTQHGWLVQNTESMFNIARAMQDGTPVTTKFLHVDGATPRHRCLEVPIGTRPETLLEAGGIRGGTVPEGHALADGGPGWCFEITVDPHDFGVRKRTNALLVLEERLVREHTSEDGQIDVLDANSWESTSDRPHEREPTRLYPDNVQIPLITNAAYEGLVSPSRPVVTVGDVVEEGAVIAEPAGEISIPQHASISGRVEDITETHIVIESE